MTLRPRLLLPVLALSLGALMALVAPSSARADTLTWIQTYSSPQSHTVNDVEVGIGAAFNAVSFSGSSGWAVGVLKDNVASTGTYTSLIAHSLNGGGTWQLETVASADELYGVAALSPTNAWAVGGNGLILHYAEGSWTSQRLAGWSGKALRAVGFSGLTGWAVGDGLGIARTTDGGLTWSTFRSPSGTAALRSVAGLGVSETAVAVGDGGKIEYIDFVSAHAQSAPSVNLHGVAFVDALSGWAVGDSATILRTSNGGLTWLSPDTSVPTMPGLLPSQSSIRAVAFADASNGIAVGQYQGVWRTSDGGSTWVVEKLVTPLPDSGNYSLRGASFAGSSTDVPVLVARSNGPDTLTTSDQTARAYQGVWTLPRTRTLTYTAGAGGTISGTSPQTVASGSDGTQVTAVPDAGYHFVAWSDEAATAVRADTNVTGNVTVKAVFAATTRGAWTLTYLANPGGSISGISPQTVTAGGSGTAVTAIPSTGYDFVNWSDGATTAARTDVNVTVNKSVTANFAIKTYVLTYAAGAHGGITGTSPQTVDYGANGAPVTAVPDAGYHFVAWSDGVTTAARTDMSVAADINATAIFAPASIATKLTMNVSPTRLSLGHSAHFYGVMAPNMPNGTPIALLVRKAGQTKWIRAGSYVRTYYSHHWSRYYHPSTRGTYYFKVQFSTTATYVGSTSRTVTVVWR